jgi:hypothetical protein
LQDLKDNPDRAHKSVVLIAWGTDDFYTYEEAKKDEDLQAIFEQGLKDVLNLGVPIVCAAGNEARTQGRQNIDTAPAVYQDQNTPLINVGGANFDGERWEGSQYGSQLTLYAPGVQIAVQAVTGFQPVLRTGTSVGTLH